MVKKGLNMSFFENKKKKSRIVGQKCQKKKVLRMGLPGTQKLSQLYAIILVLSRASQVPNKTKRASQIKQFGLSGPKNNKKLRHIKNQTYSFICYRNMPKHVQISKTRAKQNATMLHVHTVDTQNLKKNVNLICVIWNLYHLNKRYIID